MHRLIYLHVRRNNSPFGRFQVLKEKKRLIRGDREQKRILFKSIYVETIYGT